MEQQLSDLAAALTSASRHTLIGQLAPGTEAGATEQTLRYHGLNAAPTNLEALYRWHDGTTDSETPLGQIWLLPGFYLASLSEAAELCEGLKDVDGWDPNWWPVLADSAGGAYAIDLNQASREDAPILGFMDDTEVMPIMHSSIALMVEAITALHTSGAFFTNANGALDEDLDLRKSVMAKIDPAAEYWPDE